MKMFTPPNNFIEFDGKSLADFGLRCSGAGTYGSPERDVDTEEVPGRDGDLIFDNGRFKNIDATFPVSLLGENQDDYTTKIRALCAFLSSRRGYKKLRDTYRYDEYRLAHFSGGVDPEDEIMLRGSTFTLKFNCKPQRFLVEGTHEINAYSESAVYNPTYFDSKPLIMFRVNNKTEEVVATVNGTKITIDCASLPDDVEELYVDSEMMNCYSGATNCNGYVTLTDNTYPVLSPGRNEVYIGGGTHSIGIIPRWYTV